MTYSEEILGFWVYLGTQTVTQTLYKYDSFNNRVVYNSHVPY